MGSVLGASLPRSQGATSHQSPGESSQELHRWVLLGGPALGGQTPTPILEASGLQGRTDAGADGALSF